MIVKSKYDGYEEVKIEKTGKDHDFIAYVENDTGKTLKLYVDDLEGWYTEPIIIPSNDWIGFLADDEGFSLVSDIINGEFKAVLE